MKRFVIFSIIICSTVLANGQVSVGFSAGSNLSTMSIYLRDLSTFRIKPIFGYNFNFIAEYKINSNLSLNSGLTFSQKGFKQTLYYRYAPFDTAEMTSKLNYLEIPVYLKFSTTMNKTNLFYAIGPYLSYGIQGTVKTDITVSDASYTDKIKWRKTRGFIPNDLPNEYGYTSIKRFDFGIGNMVGINYNHLIFTLSYQYSLHNIMWEYYQDEKMTNSTLALSVGYLF